MRKFFFTFQYIVVHLQARKKQSMNKILYATIVIVAALASCAEQYNIQGSSSVARLDGSKLYLKALKENKLQSIDSCEVVHGKFKFAGLFDTTLMASLYMDEQSIMPLVVEQGNISVRIDDVQQSVSGTPLNELLYDFLEKHNQMDNQMVELSHRESQMLLDGIDEETIGKQLTIEAQTIAARMDSLETHFIIDNFDNVLGPGIFMMVTSRYQYPILTPQIEELMSKATDKFKNDAYVSNYYREANEIHEKMTNGDTTASNVPIVDEPTDSVVQSILNGE